MLKKKKANLCLNGLFIVLINSLCFMIPLEGAFSALQWFPTAFRMIFKFLRIVFESLSMFCRLCLSHLMPFFPGLTLLRPHDFPTISWAQKIVPPNCSCCSLFWNSFPAWVSCLLPLSPQGPIWMPSPFTNHSIQRRPIPCDHLAPYLVHSL